MKMNKLVLFFFFFLTVSFAFGQKKYVKNYYDNGVLKEEGWMENNKKVAYWFFYNTNGTKKEEGHFDDDEKFRP